MAFVGPRPRSPVAAEAGSSSAVAGARRRLHPVAAAASSPPFPGPDRLAEHWGLRPREIVDLGGERNVHWLVSDRSGEFVLRGYRGDRDDAAIAYERAVLEHLERAGWPVACPLGTPLAIGRRRYVLFARLPGQPRPHAERADEQEARGRLLGRLHAGLESHVPGQRAGWQTLDEFVRDAVPEVTEAAARRLADRPALRDVLVGHAGATHRALDDRAGELPLSVVHGDFVPWNLLWQGDALSGLIDFDDVRLDLRAADVAAARRRGRDGVVAGYRETASLTDAEVALLGPLWRAYTLRLVADLLRARVLGGPVITALEWCANEMEGTRG